MPGLLAVSIACVPFMDPFSIPRGQFQELHAVAGAALGGFGNSRCKSDAHNDQVTFRGGITIRSR